MSSHNRDFLALKFMLLTRKLSIPTIYLIPTMRDRAMQALYLLALDPVAETTGDDDSYGFRQGRSTADAIAQCFTVLRLKTSARWILEGDIKSCFDRISHEWLLAHVPMERAILRKWLKAGFMEKTVLHLTSPPLSCSNERRMSI